MKIRFGLLMLLLQASAMYAQSPTPPVPPPPVLPKLTIPAPAQDPSPTPPPVPTTTPMKLSPDVNFIISGDNPFWVLASRDGLVNVSYEDGPLKIRGKFIDAPDKIETRIFKQKHNASVEPVKDATGQVEVLIFFIGETDLTKVQRRLLDLGQMPQPPPTPPLPPTPFPPLPPTPTPVPIPDGEFRVLGLYERDTLTTQQASVMNSEPVRVWLKANCAKDSAGDPDFRFLDKDAVVSKLPQTLQDMFAAAKQSAGQLPAVVTFRGTKGTAHALPATGAELLDILKKAKAGN